ncbi:MAG: hypothetical protein ACD_2C00069G0002 [uncultured bacterium (gcode 4)]|uniref:Aminotransferase class V domain-containing protein n=1 Tax=uncultured bacterium (gcode 4) TaxID=1234023 RepID=K2G3Z6_9BACT|nr:MAG: hypothetical protein ACD_2C00069G0002 [uncultured bacterium (gcode 4)]
MNPLKNDFPIFKNNPWIVFLDNASSTQKPSHVINWITHFLENDYANIHRWAYILSEKSEILYEKSKEKVKEFIWAKYISEINYTYNSTYAMNILTLALKKSAMLKKWDKILLSISEHHANIVPWLILKDEIWIEIEYVNITSDFGLDFEDLEKKLTPDVKVVSLTYVSNVTGKISDLKKAWAIIKSKSENILFVVDWSQAVPNFKVDVQELKCDFLVFTGHKIMAETWIGVLYWRKELLKVMNPGLGWGWAINWVKEQEYSPAWLPFRFEPWTPNITWAVSLLKSLEYIESIWWYSRIEENEKELVEYTLDKFAKISKKVRLQWSASPEDRIGIFTFFIDWVHAWDVAEFMAERNVCIRAGHHCTEPLMNYCNIIGSFRMSLYLYNDKQDIDKFFEVLEEFTDNLN